MKIPYLVASFLVSLICFKGTAQMKKLILTNPSDLAHPDQLIIFRRGDLLKQFKSVDKSKFLSLTDSKGRPQIVQFDDLDKDGIWDEAVMIYNFQPKEKANFTVSFTTGKMNKAVVRAHVRHRRKNSDDTFAAAIDRDSIPAGQPNTDFSRVKLPPFLTEGPAWENDKIGFRLYFDVRNGKDIWGKTTSAMMLDTIGADPSLSYHNQSDWGMDIYKVGASLSAGALAISFKLKNGEDSLIRLGGKNMGRVVYDKIADGPVRAIFKLHYPEWRLRSDLQPVQLTEEISIWGGQFFYNSTIYIKNAPAGACLVTGFADLFNLDAHELQSSSQKVLYTYGLQSENKDNLGLAIMVPSKDLIAFSHTTSKEKEIKDTYMASLKLSDGQPLNFRFYGAWEPTDQRFKSSASFQSFLRTEVTLKDTTILKKWMN